jgi:hypothetical protein
MRRLAINSAVAVSTVLIVLALLEAGFRIFIAEEFSTPLAHVWDKDLGLRQLAGAKGRLRAPDFVTEVAINSKGLRDREYPYAKTPGTRRILCLGDSFTFGYGVEADRTFAKALERALNADAVEDGPWEVMNAGVTGTGTAHHLAYFSLEGRKYDPDFVLLSFCSKNDFSDNAKCGLYSLSDGRLVKHATRLGRVGKVRHAIESIPGSRSIMRRSRLLMFFGHRIASWIYSRREFAPEDPVAAEARRTEAYRLTESLIVALRDSCRARDCELVMAVVPEIDGGDTREEAVRLVADVRAQGVTCMDLRPAFDACVDPATEYFYAADHHWNASGHFVVARTLYDFFVKTGAKVE